MEIPPRQQERHLFQAALNAFDRLQYKSTPRMIEALCQFASGPFDAAGEPLIALPGVRQTRAFFVMKEVVENAPMEF